ncbi:MAG: DNA-binding response regulator [Alteromonas sp.]|nr:DNA-binding response regulator [Alteromonas sp.]MAY22084.1 DNA-binding response regulator [Flavobacteriaceae bacterium]|tara:strand:+ start:23349 stop:24014 length:666 start_codon:yes stop_codon:yes gene_type:complete
MNTPQFTKVAIVDDHLLFASSLERLINSFNGFQVVLKAENGADLKKKLEEIPTPPDIILLDINMPIMNGFETIKWLREYHPEQKVVTLSMDDNELFILKMLKEGARGYFLKDIHPADLEKGLCEVRDKGFCYSKDVTEIMVTALNSNQDKLNPVFRDVELEFIRLSCTEMTYREIAEELNLSPKTIDGYRQDLFKRLGVRNRVGLVMFALKHKIIDLNTSK